MVLPVDSPGTSGRQVDRYIVGLIDLESSLAARREDHPGAAEDHGDLEFVPHESTRFFGVLRMEPPRIGPRPKVKRDPVNTLRPENEVDLGRQLEQLPGLGDIGLQA